jgi:hypothetical protein
MIRKLVLALAILALPASAIAHHGWSSYDETKTIKHRAALSSLKWGSPHGTAKVRYQGATWDVILAPVQRMEGRGLSRAMVGPRQLVTIEGYPRRDGVREMRIERVTAGKRVVELR